MTSLAHIQNITTTFAHDLSTQVGLVLKWNPPVEELEQLNLTLSALRALVKEQQQVVTTALNAQMEESAAQKQMESITNEQLMAEVRRRQTVGLSTFEATPSVTPPE